MHRPLIVSNVTAPKQEYMVGTKSYGFISGLNIWGKLYVSGAIDKISKIKTKQKYTRRKNQKYAKKITKTNAEYN